MSEVPRLVISANDRVLQREITEATVAEPWQVSSPISGCRIVNTWRIYQSMQIVLAEAEDGKFRLYRSTNSVSHTLVHTHDTEIYGLFYVDDGHMIFSATDGWWKTTDAGVTWTQFSASYPAKAATIIAGTDELPLYWHLVAYGTDKVVRYMNYPDGSWAESLAVTDYWTGKWYATVSGASSGVLVGAGPYLMRSTTFGVDSWETVQTFDGTIKRVTVSDNGNAPTVLTEVEAYDSASSKLYFSYDMCDSVTLNQTRMGAVTDVQSVYPTGTDQRQTRFAVLGRRSSTGQVSYNLIEESRG